MNDRIKELAEQAVEETQLLMIMEYKNFESKLYEKFAELIVDRIDLILASEYLDCVGENDKKSRFRIDRLRERIKEYFGTDIQQTAVPVKESETWFEP